MEAPTREPVGIIAGVFGASQTLVAHEQEFSRLESQQLQLLPLSVRDFAPNDHLPNVVGLATEPPGGESGRPIAQVRCFSSAQPEEMDDVWLGSRAAFASTLASRPVYPG